MTVNKLNGKTFDIVEENISKLKELFPEIVNGDNQVDLEALQDLFEKNGDEVVGDDEEHYKFTWWGKKEAKKIAEETITKTLRPSKEDSKNWDDTKNVYIEGDNLDALKILLGSYRNKIKMIYIDPPYNTGSDFIYQDNFVETERDFLEKTNQLTEEGYLKENKKSNNSRFHANWLNMMYPRLKLARDFLTDDGVIFISIDDNEVENLKLICNEIFDERNFVGMIVWRKKRGHGRGNSHYILQTEYILTYALSLKSLPLFKKSLSEYKLTDYKFEDKLGKYKRETLEHHSPKGPYERKTLQYPIYIDGEEVYCTTGQWLWDKNHVEYELNNFIDENKEDLKYLDIVRTKDGKLRLYKKIRLTDENGNMRNETPLDIIDESNISTNSSAFEIKNLFGDKVFDFSKPTELISLLIEIGTIRDNDIIFDFFSGSGSTADAMFNLNFKFNKNIKFILVQLPELTYKINNGQKVPLNKESKNAFDLGYENICEIGKERIRRAGDKIVEESGNTDLDIGFKVFKVDESNFIPWNSNLNRENIKQAILSTGNNLVDGRKEIDLIYELLLKLNLDLNSSIDELTLDNDNKNKIYVVENGFMFICLDNNINQSLASDLLNLKEKLKSEYCQVILLDSALNDEISININETLSSEGVSFYTI